MSILTSATLCPLLYFFHGMLRFCLIRPWLLKQSFRNDYIYIYMERERERERERYSKWEQIKTENIILVSPLKKNHKIHTVHLKTFMSITQSHKIFDRGQQHTLPWDNNYGSLIVQELNIALIYQNFWPFNSQPVCCENHLKPHYCLWSLGNGTICNSFQQGRMLYPSNYVVRIMDHK
jgi:hypothetical protein